jgi:hypothetical protein
MSTSGSLFLGAEAAIATYRKISLGTIAIDANS